MELEPADDGDDERHLPPLPPDDRLWRHPSEVAAHGLPERRPRRPPWPRRLAQPWALAGLAAVTSALLTLGVVAATGGLRREVRTVPAVERVVMPATTMAPLQVSTAAGPAESLARARAAVVALVVDGGAGPVSGIVFRSDGHILTAHHAVAGAGRITVVLPGGDEVEARLLGGDPETDVALVKVDRAGIAPAALGSAAGLEPGHGVLVVDAPAGPGGDAAVASAVVRGLGRQLVPEGGPPLEDLIEADGPVSPSRAGRALVDGTGAVVGITTRAGPASGDPRSVYAVPVDYARSVAQQLLETGTVVKAWAGIEGTDLDAALAAHLGVRGGAVVKGVKEASPAGRAGLAADDVITAVNGVPVLSMGALRILLRSHRAGDAVTLAVRRSARSWSAEVALAERPPG